MNTTISIIQMVKKMLQNNEPTERIISFIDSSSVDLQFSALRNNILSCKACGLQECNHTPFAGNIHSDIMFVGECPGEQEEKQGEPFVGPAGELLTKMLAAASEKIHPRWARENVYVTNTVKCAPKDNTGARRYGRQPEIKEIAACKPFVDKEINLVKPKVIICVGAIAASTLIHPGFKISQEHGKIFGDKTKLMAIYHPSYILRKGEDTDDGIKLKIECWEDLITINNYLEDDLK